MRLKCFEILMKENLLQLRGLLNFSTSVFKKVYIDKLDNVANKYNITNHSTGKYFEFNKENNRKALIPKTAGGGGGGGGVNLTLPCGFIKKMYLLKRE